LAVLAVTSTCRASVPPPLHVTVAPLRSATRLPDVPWIGFGSPVALVTVTDRDRDRRRQQMNLRRRFDLTFTELRSPPRF